MNSISTRTFSNVQNRPVVRNLSFKGWGDKMFFSNPGKFNNEQTNFIKMAKYFSKEGIMEKAAKVLMYCAEKAKLSHRGPEVHNIGKTAGQKHVHILGYHIFLKG